MQGPKGDFWTLGPGNVGSLSSLFQFSGSVRLFLCTFNPPLTLGGPTWNGDRAGSRRGEGSGIQQCRSPHPEFAFLASLA